MRFAALRRCGELGARELDSHKLIGEPGLTIQLSVASFNPGTGILSINASGIPAGTFHLRSSADLQTSGGMS